MSEESSQAIAGQEAARYAGGVGVGSDGQHAPLGVRGRTTADMSSEERAYNRLVFGVTYQERYGKPEAVCTAYCLHPGQKRSGVRCPACYGQVAVRSWDERRHTAELSRLGRPDPGRITVQVGVICKGDVFI